MKRALTHKPYQKLKGFALEKKITYKDIGNLLGITSSTVSMKINGYSDFYLSEQKLLKKEFGVLDEFFL